MDLRRFSGKKEDAGKSRKVILIDFLFLKHITFFTVGSFHLEKTRENFIGKSRKIKIIIDGDKNKHIVDGKNWDRYTLWAVPVSYTHLTLPTICSV